MIAPAVPLPRFASKDVREFARELVREQGFIYTGANAGGHHTFVWDASGQSMQCADTPSASFWRQNAAKEAIGIVGVDCATSRLRSWAGMDRKRRPASNRPRPRPAEPRRIPNLAHLRTPRPPVLSPDERRGALVRLRRVLVEQDRWHDVVRVDAALDELGLMTGCTVNGCAVRFRSGPARLCEHHREEDAYVDVNIRYYRELMSAA